MNEADFSILNSYMRKVKAIANIKPADGCLRKLVESMPKDVYNRFQDWNTLSKWDTIHDKGTIPDKSTDTGKRQSPMPNDKKTNNKKQKIGTIEQYLK